MKVLLASPYGGVPGGISRWTEHLVNYYDSLAIKSCDLTLLPMGRSTFVNINSGILYRLKSAFRDYRKILSTFNHLIRENDYDILHLTSSASISLLKDIYMIRRAKSKGIKTIIHFRFGRIPELAKVKNWEWKWLLYVVTNVDLAIVLDKLSYDTLKNAGFDNIEILPNPVSPKVNEIVEDNKGIHRVKNSVLFAGHVVKTKGIFELVEACNTIPNVKLKLIGHVEDSIKSALLEKATCNIDIWGERPYEDVIKEMLRCDVFVLPTYTEGFPNVILESMAAGCAIVTTAVGAIPQILEPENDKMYEIIIEPQNSENLRDAIDRMLLDDKLKQECRGNVQLRVNERYSMESVWRQLTKIWISLVIK